MRQDNSGRMNVPGKAAGNWAWRVGGQEVWKKLAPEAAALRKLAYTYDRLAKGQRLDPKEN
jgi:4-alpha-glucanotransferase